MNSLKKSKMNLVMHECLTMFVAIEQLQHTVKIYTAVQNKLLRPFVKFRKYALRENNLLYEINIKYWGLHTCNVI